MEIFLSNKPSTPFPHLPSTGECCIRKAGMVQVTVTECPDANARDEHVTSPGMTLELNSRRDKIYTPLITDPVYHVRWCGLPGSHCLNLLSPS